MIKKFAIILSCGFLTFSIQAQDFGGGVILGLSTSQVGGDNLAGFHKAGLLLGVFANKSITELLSFQMEMTYIQKGSNNPNMNNAEHPNYSKQDISLSYIEVPLLLQYHQSDKLKIEGGVLTLTRAVEQSVKVTLDGSQGYTVLFIQNGISNTVKINGGGDSVIKITQGS